MAAVPGILSRVYQSRVVIRTKQFHISAFSDEGIYHIVAVKAEDNDLIDSLLTVNPDIINTLIPTGETDAALAALHVAARDNVAVNVVDSLIAKGANVKLLGPDDNTALIYAAQNTGAGTAAIVTSLLTKDDSNVDAKESVEGRTALHWAAAKSTKAVVQALLDGKADKTLTDGGEPVKTALELAQTREDSDTEKAGIVTLLTPATTN